MLLNYLSCFDNVAVTAEIDGENKHFDVKLGILPGTRLPIYTIEGADEIYDKLKNGEDISCLFSIQGPYRLLYGSSDKRFIDAKNSDLEQFDYDTVVSFVIPSDDFSSEADTLIYYEESGMSTSEIYEKYFKS